MQLDDVSKVSVASCTFSIVGSFAIIITLLVFPKQLQKAGHKLLFILSCADLLTSISYLANVLTFKIHDCTILAAVDIYFPVASFLWTDCIGIFVFVSVARLRQLDRKAYISERTLFTWFHVVSWTIPVRTRVTLFHLSGVNFF